METLHFRIEKEEASSVFDGRKRLGKRSFSAGRRRAGIGKTASKAHAEKTACKGGLSETDRHGKNGSDARPLVGGRLQPPCRCAFRHSSGVMPADLTNSS